MSERPQSNAIRIMGPETLIPEEPLLIRVQGEPYSVIMRTPGEETFHAAGFCLAEGLADRREDFASIGFCPDADGNVVDVILTESRAVLVGSLLQRKSFFSQTSCGICGKNLLEDLCQRLSPLEEPFTLTGEEAQQRVEALNRAQNLYRTTRAAHAAMVFDREGNPLSSAEDVGRHNALDKAVGKALITGTLGRASLAILSSRISFEMVQKAARAEIPMVIGLSRPTALAVTLGRELSMTLACVAKGGGFLVFCGEERFSRTPS